MMRSSDRFIWLLGLTSMALVTGCGSDDPEPPKPRAFALAFAATAQGEHIGCEDKVEGLGPDGTTSVGLSDLRFYVSNLQFKDAQGKSVALTLDTDEFQYQSTDGSVALVDLTGNTAGSCSASSVAYAEGTARTHLAITGTTQVRRVTTVSFDIGVPQPLMKKTIATNTPEGATE